MANETPEAPGSFPWHYTLDEPGALVVAASRGIEPSELRFRFDKVLGILDSNRLRHLRETNGFFTRLGHACRTSEQPQRLAEWWGERTCVERWQGLVRPDGLGRIEGPEGSVAFALELDRGTESRDQLAEKLERYGLIASGPDAPEAVLFCFTTAEREQSAREVLRHPAVSVATTSIERHRADPLGPVWRPVGVAVTSRDHAPFAEAASEALRAEVGPGRVIGCVAETVVGGDREVEGSPAVAVWLASLPEPVEAFHLEFVRTSGGGVFGGYRFEESAPAACLLIGDSVLVSHRPPARESERGFPERS